ncbi:MAG: DUF4330 domain-containing protein [Clostridiales bacterium]|jgi:hypothetical protein|nr:DUF4330 domain-containing protein [Clostridiales bacterium]
MIDKKFRLFGVVSVVDIAIFLLLILFIWLAFQFSTPRNAAAKADGVKIHYTVELQKKEPGFNGKALVGSDLYDSLKGDYIGQIIGVDAVPFLEDVPDPENSIIRRTPVEGLETVYVQVEAMARITDQATLVGPFEILVGKEIYVRTKDFASPGYVVVIDRSGEA